MKKAVNGQNRKEFIPVYPVRSLNTAGCERLSTWEFCRKFLLRILLTSQRKGR